MNKSLVLNLLIIILEIVGLMTVYVLYHQLGIVFYTVLSNILLLISSSLLVGFITHKKKIPEWLSILKYTSTICATITFLVVILVLAPMYGFNYKHMLFEHELLYLHFLCPVLSIITFVFYDKIDIDRVFMGAIATLTYIAVLLPLNLLRIVDGPYPFLRVYNQSIFMSFVWFIVMVGGSYLTGLLLKKLHDKFNCNVKE